MQNVSLSVLVLQNFRKTYGKYRKSTEGKNILCTNREIMHLCQVNKIGQYTVVKILQNVQGGKLQDMKNPWHADDGQTLNAGFGSFVIFQRIRTRMAKKPYIL